MTSPVAGNSMYTLRRPKGNCRNKGKSLPNTNGVQDVILEHTPLGLQLLLPIWGGRYCQQRMRKVHLQQAWEPLNQIKHPKSIKPSRLIWTQQTDGGNVRVWRMFCWHTFRPLMPIEELLNCKACLNIIADQVHRSPGYSLATLGWIHPAW